MTQMHLTREEVNHLTTFVKKGNKKAREITRARVLLLVHSGKKDKEIQDVLRVGRSTIWRTKKNYEQCDIAYALTERQRSGQPPKYKEKEKAEIIAFACTVPPQGRKRWTVRLLAEEMSKMERFETINRESIRLVLKKTRPSLG